MRMVGVHHVQITVPRDKEAEAREFYCGVLGLTEIEKPGSLESRGGFWARVGDRDLHVGIEDGVDRAATKAHIAYEVDDVEAWRTMLGERGFECLESIPIPGYERFEFRDPFGNRVEMIERVV
jgi:catechol 2,3-dioxygenase-like lactoylglutathione lyase family enzyme